MLFLSVKLPIGRVSGSCFWPHRSSHDHSLLGGLQHLAGAELTQCKKRRHSTQSEGEVLKMLTPLQLLPPSEVTRWHILETGRSTFTTQHVIKWRISFPRDAVTGNKVGKAQREILHGLSLGDTKYGNLNANSSRCKPCLEQSARVCMGRRTDLYVLCRLHFSLSIPYQPLPEAGCWARWPLCQLPDLGSFLNNQERRKGHFEICSERWWKQSRDLLVAQAFTLLLPSSLQQRKAPAPK